MTRVDFRWAFMKEYLSIGIIYIKAQKFLHLKQANMSVRKFPAKLNSLAKYASRVASLNRGKLEVFFGRLRSDIAKAVMIGDKPPKSLLEALGRILRLKA